MTSTGAGERRIRVTLDLDHRQYRFLRRFAFEAETNASTVLRALLTALEEDDRLEREILARVERRYSR